MDKVICFGAAGGGKRLYPLIASQYEVMAFTDNDSEKWGSTCGDIPILSPEECIQSLDYNYIIITSAPGLDSIYRQLLDMGVKEGKIITTFVQDQLEARRQFLRCYSMLVNESDLEAECAEAGVFEGDFARWINQYFPERTVHLFDTFEGFDQRDIEKEEWAEAKAGEYGNTSVEIVMSKMPYPEKVIIHKGFFPETAQGIESKFIFVNLDLDLYEPTYQGLKFFSTRMIKNGIILVHDYFSENFAGSREAVEKFLNETDLQLYRYPIGDSLSVMITGF